MFYGHVYTYSIIPILLELLTYIKVNNVHEEDVTKCIKTFNICTNSRMYQNSSNREHGYYYMYWMHLSEQYTSIKRWNGIIKRLEQI